MNRNVVLGIILILVTLSPISVLTVVPATKASPAIIAFFDDLEGFNAAAGFPPVVVDFDDIAPSIDITGLTIEGVTFDLGNQPAPSAPLIVVRGIDTYTPPGFDWSGPDNRLFATSGENVLSPGGVELAPGPNPLIENDDLALKLLTPVFAIGLDILYQSLDGASYTAITLLDAADNVLYYNGFIPIPGGAYAPGGTTFVGFVSDSSNIAKIIINDLNGNNINPDSNIGFDTIRIPKYTLAIDSSPVGVAFTVDGVSYMTPWSDVYDEGTSVSLEMPSTHMVGEARYYWDRWGDGVTSRSRTVTMNTNITLTAHYTGPYYELTVTSSPVTGIPFTINGTPGTTPYTEWLLKGFYTLIMPEIHTVGEARYYWSQWSDGVTTPSRTVTVNKTITLSAHYTGPYYQLTVTSSPIIGITFTINGVSKTTPYTEWLLEGSYTLVMPETHDGYVWSHWLEDGDTSRTKTITLTGTTWTGVFVPAPPPTCVGGEMVLIDKTQLTPSPWISPLIIFAFVTILATAISFVYVKEKKKQQT